MSLLLSNLLVEGAVYLMNHTNNACSADDDADNNQLMSPCRAVCQLSVDTVRSSLCALRQTLQPQIESLLVNLEVFLERNVSGKYFPLVYIAECVNESETY